MKIKELLESTKIPSKKAIEKAALAELPMVKTLELVKGDGYFYCVGEFRKNSVPFVSSGIYVYSLRQGMTIEQWVSAIKEVIKEAPGYDQN